MDFSAWLEVYLGGAWHVFDARNNVPRIGRVLMARGRDAADVALTTTFGLSRLDEFTVWADEIADEKQIARTSRRRATGHHRLTATTSTYSESTSVIDPVACCAPDQCAARSAANAARRSSSSVSKANTVGP